ncbi:MAG: histidine--tRNA ligase [Hadesarchaea archaeon]|nr:MAG: histidine--tRNA ligase [Hadesarchaea archaeon]
MQRPRGTRDLMGKELASVRHVMRVMSELFRRYGYAEVETPTFEHLELFTKKSGENVVRQLYAFKDKSGRDLALRPELTAPVVRLYIQQLRSFPKPVKLCYFGSCFRYEEPQAQRWRQFMQAGVEVIGSARPEADAEVVAVADSVMRELGLDGRELKIGNIRLLRKVLANAGVEGDAQDRVLRAIDSHEDGRIQEELGRTGMDAKSRQLVTKLIKLRGGVEVLEKVERLLNGIPETDQALRNFRDVIDCLGPMGVERFVVDMGIARGLEYYTDFVFEIYVGGVQVAGGGRYDTLIELLGGSSTPAVGVGFGVDRIAQTLIELDAAPARGGLDCMVLPANEGVLKECLKLVTELRRAGLSADVDLMGRKLGKAISYADSLKVKRVVVVGTRDLSEGRVIIRNMMTGKQESVSRDELAKRLKSVS